MAVKDIASLEEIVENLRPLDRKFIKLKYQENGINRVVWVYPEPMAFLDKIPGDKLEESVYIRGLNFPEQRFLQDRAEEKYSISLRHGTLRENITAYFSKETEEYNKRVLERAPVFTQEVAQRRRDEIDLRRVFKIKLIPSASMKQVFDIITPTEKPAGGRNFIIRYVGEITEQTEMPTEPGFFKNFKIVPTNKDFLKPRFGADGYWWKTNFDKEGFTAVCVGGSCLSRPEERYVSADSMSPLMTTNRIPLWTDQDPKI